MSPEWHFTEARPGDRARESQVEKFFNSDAVANRANAIVREGIQNSLDAGSGTACVRIRISIGAWTPEETASRLPKYMRGLEEHFDVDSVRNRIPDPPQAGEAFRYLAFEDFGTSGLTGDTAQWWPEENSPTSPFFNYFRAEGISDKSAHSRGRHGVGRLVFMFASRVRSMFGFTRRRDIGDSSSLLMGTAVLRNHRLQGRPYLPDAWFGIADSRNSNLTLPIEDSGFIDEFCQGFGLARREETGLSVVVPWLDTEVTAQAVTEAVLSGYFHPVLSGKLVVEIASEEGREQSISAETIDAVVENQIPAIADKVRPFVALARASLQGNNLINLNPPPETGAPNWTGDNIPEEHQKGIHELLEAGELVSLSAPVWVRRKGAPAAASAFHIFMRRDPAVADGQIRFIREGIIISDVRPRRTSGIRALVVVDDGPLATFLGDSENPAHTQWQKELVKAKYIYAPALIRYVVDSVPRILSIISQRQQEPDSSILIDLFSLPADEGRRKPEGKRPTKRGSGESGIDIPPIPATPKRYRVDQRSGGFVVQPGNPEARRPSELLVKVAYAVRRGSPLVKYNRADFRLNSREISCELRGCTMSECSDNRMRVHIDEDDFEIAVTGFDTRHRDLYVNVNVTGDEAVEVETDTGEEGEARAAAV
jgi:hypothetical protein